MTLLELLKEVATKRGELLTLRKRIRENATFVVYKELEVRSPEPAGPIMKQAIALMKEVEHLKRRVAVANVISGATDLIHEIQFLKSAISLLEDYSDVKDEVAVKEQPYGGSAILAVKKANFDTVIVKTSLDEYKARIKDRVAELDKINFNYKEE